jgi:uncharacterized protein YegP (UPF0339 family)
MSKRSKSPFSIKNNGSGFYFTITATNGECLATSEIYSSRAKCKEGVESLKRTVFNQVVDEMTSSTFDPEGYDIAFDDEATDDFDELPF